METQMHFDLKALFFAARINPKNPMNQPGRLTGRHCKARLQRAQAKRIAKNKRPFHPAFGHRLATES
jgi:hypothetical protein